MLCGPLCCFRFHETTKVFSLTPNKEMYELDLFFHNKKKKIRVLRTCRYRRLYYPRSRLTKCVRVFRDVLVHTYFSFPALSPAPKFYLTNIFLLAISIDIVV